MRKLIWMLAALLTLAPAAFAQTAQEMTDRCALSSVGKKTLDRMTDGDYRTYWASSSNGSAYVEIEAEDAIGGVYVRFYDDTAALDVQTRDASTAAYAAKNRADSPEGRKRAAVYRRIARPRRRRCAGLGAAMAGAA